MPDHEETLGSSSNQPIQKSYPQFALSVEESKPLLRKGTYPVMNLRNRRSFIKDCSYATAAIALTQKLFSQSPARTNEMQINIFSKHLQFLGFEQMAKVARDIGFDGIDLTVRPDGHIEPSRVKSDLPKAAAIIRETGLALPMITTAVDDASDSTDRHVIETASELAIGCYRMNWFPYPKNQSQPEAIKDFRQQIAALGRLNDGLGIVGCYQNHAGLLVGASLWEVWQILQDTVPSSFGVQYDIRHATVEAGLSWPNGFQLVKDRIKSIVLKDFKWEKKEGRTQITNTPIGEGMVDFKKYFRMLKDAKLKVPVSLHLEYDIGGAQWGQRTLSTSEDSVYAAMSKDLTTVRKLWADA